MHDGIEPNGSLVLVAPDGSTVAEYPAPHDTGGAAYIFTGDGKSFAVARGTGEVTVHDATTGKTTATFRAAGPATGVAVSADGTRVAIACGDGPILVFAVDR